MEKAIDPLATEQELTIALREIEPVARQLLSYYDDLKHLSEEMEEFEEQYGLSSGDFYAKWEDGQLGDETDFFEWFAYCDTYRRLVEKIYLLGKELHDLLPNLISFPPEGVPARVAGSTLKLSPSSANGSTRTLAQALFAPELRWPMVVS